jgi:fructose/tagatose bisphosphate aldolase
MLVSMKEMLAHAKENHYAIPAFDVSNYEMMRAVLDVCEEERSPALLMMLGVDLAGKGLPLLSSMVKAASEYYTVPVCLHLDHATNMEDIKAAVEAGFSSVMYDGSALPFEENASMTEKVVAYAHAHGVTVEAELGHVGNAMVGNENDSVENEDPDDRAVKQTSADVMAEDEVDILDFIDQDIGPFFGERAVDQKPALLGEFLSAGQRIDRDDDADDGIEDQVDQNLADGDGSVDDVQERPHGLRVAGEIGFKIGLDLLKPGGKIGVELG